MNDKATIANILKVNHAGERGAIRIYQAQRLVARIFYKDLDRFLVQMLDHEIDHCKKFREAMVSRDVRPCYALWLWGIGGYTLGLMTGLMGRNMIMVCTEAVEEAVHRHLNEQINFLTARDDDLKNLIRDIQVEELDHLNFARARVRHTSATKLGGSVIDTATEILIWLSTQGALGRMKSQLAAWRQV
jgi:ubiquinone biosynthesis monooxygenase Coq7